MTKTISVSDDSGSNWYAIPGPKGAFDSEASKLKDTVLGQTYESGFPGLITWSVKGDGYYKGFAGYEADLKKTGTLTAVTGEAMTNVTGQIYQITDSAKQVWDWVATLTVYDNGSAVASSNIESIDYLFGKVTFVGAYSVTGPVTIDVSYYPLSTFGKGRDFTLKQTANALDTSDYQTVQANGGYRTHDAGLRTISLDINGIFSASDDWQSVLQARDTVLIEINADGNSKSIARGWFSMIKAGQEGDVGNNEMEKISFELNVADPTVDPFGWYHASDTTLPAAVQKCLTAFENITNIMVQYLYDGISGYEGDSVVTECSLTSSIDSMNEFAFTFTGDGAYTSV